jgi:hypothetical protein
MNQAEETTDEKDKRLLGPGGSAAITLGCTCPEGDKQEDCQFHKGVEHDVPSKYFNRHAHLAKHCGRWAQMIIMFREATSKEELNRIMSLFMTDMGYERADICLALKTVEFEKGWRGRLTKKQ